MFPDEPNLVGTIRPFDLFQRGGDALAEWTFEVTDLDDLRNDIAGLTTELTLSTDPLLTKFDGCAAMPILSLR